MQQSPPSAVTDARRALAPRQCVSAVQRIQRGGPPHRTHLYLDLCARRRRTPPRLAAKPGHAMKAGPSLDPQGGGCSTLCVAHSALGLQVCIHRVGAVGRDGPERTDRPDRTPKGVGVMLPTARCRSNLFGHFDACSFFWRSILTTEGPSEVGRTSAPPAKGSHGWVPSGTRSAQPSLT